MFKGNPSWRIVVFGLYSILSLCCLVLCTNIYPLDTEPAETAIDWKEVQAETFAVGLALTKSQRLILLIPYQICFGLHTCFIGLYVNRKIVAGHLGDGYIGMITAVATITATVLAAPYAKISNISSKYFIMVFGAICFAFCGSVLLIFSDEQVIIVNK